MAAAPQKKPKGFIHAIRRILFSQDAPAASRPAAGRQQEVEALLSQLFAKKSLVTSGRLQLLGFDNVREALGDAWPLARASIYRVADETIRTIKAPEDIFLRYRDDSYVLIFPSAEPAEALARATRIAEEIGRRTEEIGEAVLRLLRVDGHACAVETTKLAGRGLQDIVGALFDTVSLDAADSRATAQEEAELRARLAAPRAPSCAYVPLWDVRRKALSAYLCEPEAKAGSYPIDRDLELLQAAKAGLQEMHARGENFILIVPVRHGTLYNTDSGRKYQAIYRDIPEAQRKNLIFVVTNYIEGLPEKDVFWFLPALKAAARHVFVEMPLRTRASFSALKALGVDGLGVAAAAEVDESVLLGYLQNFAGQAQQAGIPQTFAFGVGSLSLATSASCMGFSWLGGGAIHGSVQAPDKSHRFRYASLFTGDKVTA
jgi:GGDEF domain-containing protein